MRTMLAAAAFLSLALPLAAQSHDHAAAPAGQHQLPAGWHGRTDRPNQSLGGVMFMAMGKGFHVKSGPAAILWNPAHAAQGNFIATATFSAQAQPVTEAYGLVLGGRNLDQPDVDYAYFIVRGDGSFMIRHRAGAELHTLVPWTKHAAVRKPDAAGAVSNTLSVDAGAQKIRYLVNGTEVAAFDRNAPMNADGIVGLRVNHNLELLIPQFTITRK